MTDLFLRVVELSWQAGVLALAVMLARLALRRAPKWAVCMLWALVAVRLIVPVSLQSRVSLQAEQSPVTAALEQLPQTQETADAILPGGGEVLTPVQPVGPVTSAEPVQAARPVMTVEVLTAVWLAGAAVMLAYMLVSYLRLYRQVRTAVRVEDNVCRCDRWGTPFVLGMLRPRIYIPAGLDEPDLSQVLAHERGHIRRGDHVVKPLAFLLLTVHWFNPVLWAAYVLLGRDMENACDERVLRTLDGAGRAAYSRALVACAVRQRPAAVCPLAFGETAVKERVKNAMSYRKPALWAAVLLLIAAAVIGVCFLTSPQRQQPAADGDWDAETLYALRTPYVGDNSAVGGIISAIGLDQLGAGIWDDFSIRLSTEQEPYGLTLCYGTSYENVVGAGEGITLRMEAGGYLAMALVDNLDWVAWQMDGVESGRVTNDGVYDIAAARQSVDGLRQLIDELEADLVNGTVGGGRQAYYSPASVTREDGVSARLANVTYQGDRLTGELRVTLPAAAAARYAGEGGTASLLNDFTLYAQTDDGPKNAVAEDVRIEKNGEDTVLCQLFSLGIQIPTSQGFTVRFWAGELGPLLAEVTAEGAAASEITPWPSEGDNDPVSIDPADYGIVYDTEHMPDWETCPLSYLCAYYLGADGAYAQGAMDTLAQRYRQAPNTVQNYLDTLAAKYAGVDRQLLSQIRLAAESLYGTENGTSADPLVELLYNESFDYSDGVGNSGHYTYRVPQLLADTADARAINAAIADEYGPIVEETLDDRASGVSLSCLYVMWESYRCGDILSLVVSCGWSFDSNQYSVYLYDTARGVRLTTSELLTAQGVDETAFLNAVRQAAADRFDALYSQTGDAAAERRTWTLSDANINRDVPAYADAAGHLYAVLPIGSPAGADAYEQVLALDVGA